MRVVRTRVAILRYGGRVVRVSNLVLGLRSSRLSRITRVSYDGRDLRYLVQLQGCRSCSSMLYTIVNRETRGISVLILRSANGILRSALFVFYVSKWLFRRSGVLSFLYTLFYYSVM